MNFNFDDRDASYRWNVVRNKWKVTTHAHGEYTTYYTDSLEQAKALIEWFLYEPITHFPVPMTGVDEPEYKYSPPLQPPEVIDISASPARWEDLPSPSQMYNQEWLDHSPSPLQGENSPYLNQDTLLSGSPPRWRNSPSLLQSQDIIDVIDISDSPPEQSYLVDLEQEALKGMNLLSELPKQPQPRKQTRNRWVNLTATKSPPKGYSFLTRTNKWQNYGTDKLGFRCLFGVQEKEEDAAIVGEKLNELLSSGVLCKNLSLKKRNQYVKEWLGR